MLLPDLEFNGHLWDQPASAASYPEANTHEFRVPPFQAPEDGLKLHRQWRDGWRCPTPAPAGPIGPVLWLPAVGAQGCLSHLGFAVGTAGPGVPAPATVPSLYNFRSIPRYPIATGRS